MIIQRPTRPPRTNNKKRHPFHRRGLECKSRKSKDTWNNNKFGLGVQNVAGQRLIEFCQENTLIITNTLLTSDDCTIVHHQMVRTKIRLIIFFAAEDGEARYSRQKQDLDLTVAQIISSLLKFSDSN